MSVDNEHPCLIPLLDLKKDGVSPFNKIEYNIDFATFFYPIHKC